MPTLKSRINAAIKALSQLEGGKEHAADPSATASLFELLNDYSMVFEKAEQKKLHHVKAKRKGKA